MCQEGLLYQITHLKPSTYPQHMKGEILEQIIQKIILDQGYEELDSNDPKFNPSTDKFKGRGTEHELDAFGQYRHSIPFVSPIRLFVEAKCYKPSRSVGVDIIREAIAVQKDINENYVSQSRGPAGDRRLECFAVFSVSGFSSSAKKLAHAHGIRLVSVSCLRSHINKINNNSNLQTHKEVKRAVDTYLEMEHLLDKVHFASLIGGQPVVLHGELPEEKLLATDVLELSTTDISKKGDITQIVLQDDRTDGDQRLIAEIPIWILEDVADWNRKVSLSLVVPTVLDGLTRRIRIETRFDYVKLLE